MKINVSRKFLQRAHAGVFKAFGDHGALSNPGSFSLFWELKKVQGKTHDKTGCITSCITHCLSASWVFNSAQHYEQIMAAINPLSSVFKKKSQNLGAQRKSFPKFSLKKYLVGLLRLPRNLEGAGL